MKRTGLHRRLSLAILKTIGANGGQARLLLAFMVSAALLSMLISNTSTALIMMPMALAVLGCGLAEDAKDGLAGALPMGIAFAASIGGLGRRSSVRPPTPLRSVCSTPTIGVSISFAQWTLFGLPIVVLGVPIAAFIIAKVQKVSAHPFDVGAARAAIDTHAAWSSAERRLVPVVALAFLLWMTRPLLEPYLPDGSLTDGTIAIAVSLLLFIAPDGDRAAAAQLGGGGPRAGGIIMMFGGGLALAAGMTASGLATWLGMRCCRCRSGHWCGSPWRRWSAWWCW